jgi:hypothetical protein
MKSRKSRFLKPKDLSYSLLATGRPGMTMRGDLENSAAAGSGIVELTSPCGSPFFFVE